MPVHDWTLVKAGVFHHFHHSWIEEFQRALNGGLLPPDHYAMAEQRTGRFGPDVLTLERIADEPPNPSDWIESSNAGPGLVLADPETRIVVQGDLAFYRAKQKRVVVRHVSGDAIVAMIEVVSPGNKSSRPAVAEFSSKAAALVAAGIHLVVLDLLPPTPACPDGIHASIWQELQSEECEPFDRPLTLASYEATEVPRAFIEPVAVGDRLPDMPLFLRPGAHVPLPIERTYQSAFAAVPNRWRTILSP